MIGKAGLGIGLVDDLLVDRFFHIEHVPEVAGELFLLKQFLRVMGLVPDSSILDAVHQRLSLAAIDGLRGKLDELLRITPEVVETTTP